MENKWQRKPCCKYCQYPTAGKLKTFNIMNNEMFIQIINVILKYNSLINILQKKYSKQFTLNKHVN